MPQQVAAIYQLQRYPEYKFASVPVLEMLQELKIRDNNTKAINTLLGL